MRLKILAVLFLIVFAKSVSAIGTYTVTTNADAGGGTLRQAILDANGDVVPSTIIFNITTASKTIAPVTPFASITQAVTIDATTQPTYTYTTGPLVIIDGTSTPVQSLLSASAPVTIRGLAFINVSGDCGITLIAGSDGSIIEANYIGTADGITSSPTFFGIVALFTNSITIGGSTPAQRNIISGCEQTGVQMTGNYNIVIGNYIGTSAAGTTSLGNAFGGVSVTGNNNRIGGTGSGEGNLVSGNGVTGIAAGGDNNTILGNLVGTDKTGTYAIPNIADGISISGTNSSVGGIAPGSRNIISGNANEGMEISGAGIMVLGNYLGLDITGTVKIKNGSGGGNHYGISITTSGNISIGNGTLSGRNVITANDVAGIYISGGSDISIKGNFIGTDKNCSIASGSDKNTNGILTSGGTNLFIGSNVISGDNITGLSVQSSSNVTIAGNYVGPDTTGLKAVKIYALASSNTGIDIQNPNNVVVGGTASADRNIISGCGVGMVLNGSAVNSQVINNYIGVDKTGNAALPNIGTGIDMLGGYYVVGNGNASGRNIISGNGNDGISLSGGFNTVKGNYIGVSASGILAIANDNGIGTLNNSSDDNTVGGANPGDGNIISGNRNSGIRIFLGDFNTVQGNYIGLDANGSPLGNADNGVFITGGAHTDNNYIGGATLSEGNHIAYNAKNGINISSVASFSLTCNKNLISHNLIWSNGSTAYKAINLNTSIPSRAGNDGYPKPVFTNLSPTVLSGYARPGDVVEMYKNLNASEQNCNNAEVFVGEATADLVTGYFSLTGVSLAPGDIILATATSRVIVTSLNNTSEFSCNYVISHTVAPNPLCAGSSAAITASGADPGSIYVWSPASGLNITTGTNVSYAGITAGTHTIAITGTITAMGIKGVAVVSVTVTAMPSFDINYPQSGVCTGNVATLETYNEMGNTPFTYVWSPASLLTSTTGTQVNTIQNPPGTYTYNVIGIDTYGCTRDSNLVISVLASPTLLTSTNVSLCTGNTATFNVSGASLYSWTGGTTPTSGATVSYTPSSAGINSFTVIGTDPNSCQDKEIITLITYTTPSVTATSDITSICGNVVANMTAAGSSSGSYKWTPPTGLDTTTKQTVTFTPYGNTGIHTFNVSFTSTEGCAATDAINIDVLASLVINPGEDVSICMGTTASLTATGANTIQWDPGNIMNAILNVSPITYTTYTVTGTTGLCTDIAIVSVDVWNLPIVTAQKDVTVCAGETVSLTAYGASTYLWSQGSTTDILTYIAATTIIHEVTGIDNNGCEDTAAIIAKVNPLPIVDAGPDQNITAGQITILAASGADTYLWSTGENAVSIQIQPSVTTTYTVTGSLPTGCSDKDEVTIYTTTLCGDIFVPNAFSPNNDGENDILYAEDHNCVRLSFLFYIYDRWGNRVYESSDISEGWNGKSKHGKEFDNGVYVYKLVYTSTSGTKIKIDGNISLIR